LTHLNIGIGKEDYSLLAKSSLAAEVSQQEAGNRVVIEQLNGLAGKKNYAEDDLFSDGC